MPRSLFPCLVASSPSPGGNRTKQTGFRQNDGNAPTAERLATQHGVSAPALARKAILLQTMNPRAAVVIEKLIDDALTRAQAVVKGGA